MDEIKTLKTKPFLRLPADPGAQQATGAPVVALTSASVSNDGATVLLPASPPPKRARKPQEQPVYTLDLGDAHNDHTGGAPTGGADSKSETSCGAGTGEGLVPSPVRHACVPISGSPPTNHEAPLAAVASGEVLSPVHPAPHPSEPGAPFRRSRKASGEQRQPKLKVLLYGEPGTGKTVTSLSFPRPLMIDLEGGSEVYEDAFEFQRLDANAFGGPPANDWERLEAAVDHLISHPEHGCETLIIDPITVAWEACHDMWTGRFLKFRRAGQQGHKHEFYDLQPADWRHLKGSLKGLFRKLARLDMHIIATAREKPLYAEGAMMRRVGETFDGDRNLPYYFDAVCRLERRAAGGFRSTTLKARNFLLRDPRYEYAEAPGMWDVFRARLEGAAEPDYVPRGRQPEARQPTTEYVPEHIPGENTGEGIGGYTLEM